MPQFDHYELRNTQVGGKLVGFTKSTSTLQLAGEDVPVEEWLEIRRRIDVILKRELTPADWQALREKMAWLGKKDRLPKELRDYEAPQATRRASSFLGNNIDAINGLERGKLRKAPVWLRWLFDSVVTKEEYGN